MGYLKTADTKPEMLFAGSFHLLRWNTSYASDRRKSNAGSPNAELRTDEYQVHEQLGS